MNGLRQNNLFSFLQFIVIGPFSSVKAYKKSSLKILSQTFLKMQTSCQRQRGYCTLQQHSQPAVTD